MRKKPLVRIVKHIRQIKNKYPLSSQKYRSAHLKANIAEKKRYGVKRFKALNKVLQKLPYGQLAGVHTKKGIVKVSRKVPKKYRRQVAYHEVIEHRIMHKKQSRYGKH